MKKKEQPNHCRFHLSTAHLRADDNFILCLFNFFVFNLRYFFPAVPFNLHWIVVFLGLRNARICMALARLNWFYDSHICNTEINKINIHFRCSHKRNCIYNHKIECKKMYIVPTRHGCYERSVQHPSSWVALGASFFCVYWEVAMIVHSTLIARK